MFTGSLVALITPFRNGSVDEKGFEKFVAWQIKEGTDGAGPVRHHRRVAHPLDEEHKRVIDICISAAKGSGVPVIAGTGSNNDRRGDRTHPARQERRRRRAMLVVPYYNKPTQEGLFQHFKAVAEAVDMPILHLQRAAAHRRRHARRDRDPPVAGPGTSSASRTRATTWRARPDSASRRRRASCSSRARMRARSDSWRRAATAASR
jgi:hypothetical protein